MDLIQLEQKQMDIGMKLMRYRESKGITLKQVQDKTGISRSNLDRLEQGVNVTLSTLIRYLDVLELDFAVKKR